MKKQTYPIPEGCKAISMEIIDNAIVTTFEPEKVEFKKGDVIVAERGILILEEQHNKLYNTCFVKMYNDSDIIYYGRNYNWNNENTRLATATEKQQLFDALAKENKAWDAEKMEIVELKYIPKEGDCVRFNKGCACIKKIIQKDVFKVGDWITGIGNFKKEKERTLSLEGDIYTKITPEELQAEFNKLGYEYDFETHEAKKLRFRPAMGERYAYLDDTFCVLTTTWENWNFDNIRYNTYNCFKNEAEAQNFKDYILKYDPQKNN